MHKQITFICTGNVCRSPMAEYLFRDMLGRESEWITGSAGTFAGNGMPASRAAVEVLAELGIDGSRHRSRFLDRDLVDGSDIIVVMTSEHLHHMEMVFPEAVEKTFLLKSFSKEGKGDVMDPIGASVDIYRHIRDEIRASLPGLAEFITKYKKNGNII